jgi:hypothetical protein
VKPEMVPEPTPLELVVCLVLMSLICAVSLLMELPRIIGSSMRRFRT